MPLCTGCALDAMPKLNGIAGSLLRMASSLAPRLRISLRIDSTALTQVLEEQRRHMSDPLIPRAIFGILNTLLYFPSGAIYPVQAFPKWLAAIAAIDPFTYSVHGFKSVLLKGVGLAAIWPDLLYLGLFAAVTFTLSTLMFKRTL